jgi:hypothetical protein
VFGVANGTACRMVCMAWDGDEDFQVALAAVETHTELGGICILPMPPDHIIVSVRAAPSRQTARSRDGTEISR